MVYFGKKASGNIEALRQEIETLKQALNNCAKKNTTNAFTEQQDFQSIKIGSHFYFAPETNALRIRPDAEGKWLYFGTPNDNNKYFAGIDLNNRVQLAGIKAPTQNSHAVNKQYVDNQLNNIARTNQQNTFSANQTFRGQVEFTSEIRAGNGGSLIKFLPEDTTTKTLQFYDAQPTDSKRLMLNISDPTDNNHATNKQYVDNRIKYIEKVGGITFREGQVIVSGKIKKYWATVNYSDLGIPNGKTIISCNIAKPADSKHLVLAFFPKNAQNQCLIEIYQYNETTNIANALGRLTYCFTYIN